MSVTINDAIILDKAKHARHRGFAYWDQQQGQQLVAHGENPFCGDELEIRLALSVSEQGSLSITHAAFDGYGCTLCIAAAEAVTEHIEGLSLLQASMLTFDDVCRLLGGLEVGRTRKGCVELAASIACRALLPMIE